MELTDERIAKLLVAYKKKREYEKKRYHRLKHDEDFREKNRKAALDWYNDNKDKKKDYYIENKEYLKAVNTYLYWKKKDMSNEYKVKYPERYQLLLDKNYLDE